MFSLKKANKLGQEKHLTIYQNKVNIYITLLLPNIWYYNISENCK